MLNCPFCGDKEFYTVDVRNKDKVNGIRRRRECKLCGKRFTTYEVCPDMYDGDKEFPSQVKDPCPGLNFKKNRLNAIKTATDLGYDKYIIRELENAKDENELTHIMTKGRHRCYAD